MPSLAAKLTAILFLPRADQPAAAMRLHASLSGAAEAWNSAFAPGSLFDAFSQSTVAGGVYEANRAVLGPILRDGFRVVEIGGGNGRLWRGLISSGVEGEIVVVDPHPEGSAGVRSEVPESVAVRHICAPAQEADLPDSDVVIASLVLHHVAGTDRAHRRGHGLSGNGKRELLVACANAAPRVIVNEADIYCDLDLPPGDALLRERLCDSYVRRFAVSLADDIAGSDDPDLRARWTAVVRDWSLGQLSVADVPVGQRDVYELDVSSWLRLLDSAGLRVESRQFTDRYLLFHQYVCARQ